MINNKKPLIRERRRFNDFLATNLESNIENRYCKTCHIKLVHNPRNSPYDRHIYSCPICNCTANIHQTEPEEKIMVQFPTHNATTGNTNKKLIAQPEDQRVSRAQYFINKNIQKKNEIENSDPYLRILKQRNDIKITNVEYYDDSYNDMDYD